MVEISTVGVVGAGQMGNGIAHVAACAGFDVRMTDISQAALDQAVATIEKNLGRMVKKERLFAPEADAALGRIQGHIVPSSCKPLFLVRGMLSLGRK